MKKLIYPIVLLFIFAGILPAQQVTTTKKVPVTYTRPIWTIGVGGMWNLATNDAYGRANYADQSNLLYDNFGMRWGWGAYVVGKYSPAKLRHDRLFLSVDYKSMINSDFESDVNKTKYNIYTFGAGYEYVFYGSGDAFRSYYGGALTGNLISGEFLPGASTTGLSKLEFEQSFRMGLELRTGLEFVIKNERRNLGINLGARYNLMNLFNDDNRKPDSLQTSDLNLNDGDEVGSGPGYKRYLGMVSIDIGLNIYPDSKKKVRK